MHWKFLWILGQGIFKKHHSSLTPFTCGLWLNDSLLLGWQQVLSTYLPTPEFLFLFLLSNNAPKTRPVLINWMDWLDAKWHVVSGFIVLSTMAWHWFFKIRVAKLVYFFQKFRRQEVAIVCPESRVNSKHWHKEKCLNQAGRSKLSMGQTAT